MTTLIISDKRGDLGPLTKAFHFYHQPVTDSNIIYASQWDHCFTRLKKEVTSAHIEWGDSWLSPEGVVARENLLAEIRRLSPSVILTLGDLPLLLLTKAYPAEKWRGSYIPFGDATLIPTVHPRVLVYSSSLWPAFSRDIQRFLSPIPPLPKWKFQLRPSISAILETLETLRLRGKIIDIDIETRNDHIACLGISWSKLDAIVIPFMCVGEREGYWSSEEEGIIVHALYRLLTTTPCRYQNGLFDSFFIYSEWHFIPRHGQDTMISHHTLFAGLRKSLAFQASLYCEHYLYWKDDGRLWAPSVGEDQLWAYNAQDCVRTREVGDVLTDSLEKGGLTHVDAHQQALFPLVLNAMIRGINVDLPLKARFSLDLDDASAEKLEYFHRILGHPFDPAGRNAMLALFYGDFAQRPIMTRAKKGIPGHVTLDDDALTILGVREPLLLPLIEGIKDYRSIGVFNSTFVQARVDTDKRFRCGYNICGTETFRLSSSKNIFGIGTNFQNLPKGDEAKRLPNIRRLFIPDEGCTFFDLDLDRADAQVVVWESDEAELKDALRKGVDLHLLNAFALKGIERDMNHLVETHPEYPRLREIFAKERQLAKAFIHGTNYGGSPATMARAAGITVAESERFQGKYFGRYPGIKKWHERTARELAVRKCVTNRFGYRRMYFGGVDKILPEALAWQPQSTVGIVINRAWKAISDNIPAIEILLQVHDSLAGQFPTRRKDELVPLLLQHSRVTIPYEDPLTIPSGVKMSTKSWGEVA